MIMWLSLSLRPSLLLGVLFVVATQNISSLQAYDSRDDRQTRRSTSSSPAFLLEPWCNSSIRLRFRNSGGSILEDIPGALVQHCDCGDNNTADEHIQLEGSNITVGNIRAAFDVDKQTLSISRVDDGQFILKATIQQTPSVLLSGGFSKFTVVVESASGSEERIYGLGELENTPSTGGCDAVHSAFPLNRNNITVDLAQHKFHVSIPFVYSSAGYGFLFNQAGSGSVTVGQGSSKWTAEASQQVDLWLTVTDSADDARQGVAGTVYQHYADATGYSPPLTDRSAMFWQSRLRYRNSTEVVDVAQRYHDLDLPLGVLVIDFFNQKTNGDFQLNPQCYGNVSGMVDQVTSLTNANLITSIWPNILPGSLSYDRLKERNCIANGVADATSQACRNYIWDTFGKPNYADRGVTGVWLDESDLIETDLTGMPHAGPSQNLSCGPLEYCGRIWANNWIQLYSDGFQSTGLAAPIILTRGLWAGAQRYGPVLWSSDIMSEFTDLAVQVPEGVAASLSGIPYWTTDIGGFGCPTSPHADNDPYMKELIVRWYQFGTFCPIMRTHGCRKGQVFPALPGDSPCITGQGPQGSCGPNEPWSYGSATQMILEKYIRLRNDVIGPYMVALSQNVSKTGEPTMRPMWYDFPSDPKTTSVELEGQYMLGPKYLVAPVVVQGATSRTLYLPEGATFRDFWNTSTVFKGGQTINVTAPLDMIPIFVREGY